MLTVTIIPDCPSRTSVGGLHNSILSMPLGTGTVLEHLCAQAARAGSADVWILQDAESGSDSPAPNGASGKATQLGQTTIRFITRAQLTPLIDALEPSDQILFLDPHHWPADGFQLAALKREAMNSPGAVHAAAVGADQTGATERVVCDETGRVARIRRLYSGVTQTLRHHGVVMHSILPVAAMQEIEFTRLSDLPTTLAAAGIVTRDIPIATDLIDLANPHEYLALCEQITSETVRTAVPHGHSRLAVQVLVGRGVLVHESARIIGPVIIQSGTLIEENVTIIGPTLIGAGVTICRDAVVAQSVVSNNALIHSGAVVRHCITPLDVSAVSIEQDDAQAWSEDFLDAAIQSDDGEQERIAPELDDRVAGSRVGLACKRVVDIGLSLAVIVLTLPITITAAILVKLTSRGPLFFIHEREGRGGRPFPCLKFRTMIADAHELQRRLQNQNMLDGPHFKISNDPRVTRIGRILRKYNIDELPQLLNVLWGHMSLVGPRPSPFRENQYCIPWRRARLSVRPGVTGIWQICRSGRHDGDFQQWIYFDMIYVRKMTPMLDLRILLATAYSLLTGAEIPLARLMKPESIADQALSDPRTTFAENRTLPADRGPLVASAPIRAYDSVN